MNEKFEIRYITPVFLLAFCFIIPLQVYLIGGDNGIGIQGALYRFQITGYGTGLITLQQDIGYIMSGMYEGKTAVYVILWTLASCALVLAAIAAFVKHPALERHKAQMISCLMVSAGLVFLLSLVIQYGMFLQGPAGISLPFGVLLLIVFGVYSYWSRDIFF